MNQLKRKRSNGGGISKRQANIFADSTGMTSVNLDLIATETETPKNMTKCDCRERSRILKFSMHHQDQSMESSINEGERSASTYPCRSRAEAFKRTGLMESYSS